MAIIAIVRGSIASSLVLVLVFKVAHYAGRLITPGATVSISRHHFVALNHDLFTSRRRNGQSFGVIF
jgi:hypothetical protein